VVPVLRVVLSIVEELAGARRPSPPRTPPSIADVSPSAKRSEVIHKDAHSTTASHPAEIVLLFDDGT
jgi:hypothetical protein